MRFFRGELSLAFSFWFIYFGTNVALQIVIALLPKENISYPDNNAGLIIIILKALYLLATVIGTWNSATNYSLNKKEKNLPGFNWSILVKILMGVAVLNQLWLIYMMLTL
tara:strand:- start:386 stop:715 length:330 start_codon:yes stop_codon:yes gene_type:complete